MERFFFVWYDQYIESVYMWNRELKTELTKRIQMIGHLFASKLERDGNTESTEAAWRGPSSCLTQP